MARAWTTSSRTFRSSEAAAFSSVLGGRGLVLCLPVEDRLAQLLEPLEPLAGLLFMEEIALCRRLRAEIGPILGRQRLLGGREESGLFHVDMSPLQIDKTASPSGKRLARQLGLCQHDAQRACEFSRPPGQFLMLDPQVTDLLRGCQVALMQLCEYQLLSWMMTSVRKAQEIVERRADHVKIRLVTSLEFIDLPLQRPEKGRHIAMFLTQRPEGFGHDPVLQRSPFP